ncbi:hypothetical protein CHARACLAT_030964 [Characodon lateralis]|uniref:Uncharacterized protein n=1 Tax=Characodon lateralis TaxID=208331 RepID=A0ABU7F9F4_9TELE|nr:hypothetical protein [Characodon lateralis]
MSGGVLGQGLSDVGGWRQNPSRACSPPLFLLKRKSYWLALGLMRRLTGTTVHNRKRVACPLWVGREFLPQVEEFTSEGRMKREIDRGISAAAAVCCGEKKA